MSDTAKDFIKLCLTRDPTKRPTCLDLLNHPWFNEPHRHLDGHADVPEEPSDLLPYVQQASVERASFLFTCSCCSVKIESWLVVTDRRAVELRRNPSASAPAYLSSSAHKLLEDLIVYTKESEEVRRRECPFFFAYLLYRYCTLG